jgi:hypothetical protein
VHLVGFYSILWMMMHGTMNVNTVIKTKHIIMNIAYFFYNIIRIFFITVPCMLFQSLHYCSNSCTLLGSTCDILELIILIWLMWWTWNNKHEYGTANETLKLLKPCNKGLKMNCWGSFYIQMYRQSNRLITEQLTGDYNPLYKQAYFACDLQHIPWHSLDQIGVHTHTHRRLSLFYFILIIVNISDSGLDNLYF